MKLHTYILLGLILIGNQWLIGQDELKVIMQAGHYAPVTCVDYSPNGKLFVTGSEDETLKLWEVATGREVRSFLGHSKSVTTVKFSPNGKQVVSVAYDRKAIIWDVETGAIVATFKDSLDQIRNAIFTPDGKQLITGGHKTNAVVWDITSQKRVGEYKKAPSTCYQCIPSLAMSKDGELLLTGSGDRTAMLWNTAKRDTIQSFHYSPGWCSSCAGFADLSSDQKCVLLAEDGNQLCIVSIKTGEIVQTLLAEADYQSVGYSPNNKLVAAILGYRGELKVWDISSGEIVLAVKSEEGIKGFAFSPDSKSILTANANHTIGSWDILSKQKITTFKGIVNRPAIPRLNDSQQYYLDKLSETALNHKGTQLAFFKRSEDVVIWDLNKGKASIMLNGHKELVTCLAYSNSDELIATGSLDRSIIIWNANTGEMILEIEAHSAMLFSIEFSADDKYLVSTSWDGTSVLWDVKKGERISRMDVHDGSPYSAAITNQGLYVLTGGLDKELKLTEVDTRKTVKSFIGPTEITSDIFFVSELNVFVSAGWDKKIRVWDIHAGLQTMKLTGHDGPVYCVDIDEQRKYIVSGSDDKTAKLWDFNTGELIRTFEGHSGAITNVQLFDEGTRLMTSSRDGSVKIWNLESGEEIITHFSLDKNEWAVKTPKGYFDATVKTRKNLFFVKGTKTYSLDQFFDQFYQPGIMKEVLGESSSYDKREGSIFKALKNSPPPSVTILAPLDKTTKKDRGVELIIKVKNNGGGINEIKVLHNGKRINHDVLTKVPSKGYDMTKSYRLLLVPGANTIETSAFSDARIESAKEVVHLYYEGTQKIANCFVVAVGINEYENANLNLNYAKADASEFVKTFNDNGGELYKNIFLFPVYDKEATRKKILSVIDSVSAFIEPEDVFLFYYAGHGGMSGNDFYFIPSDNISLYQKTKLDKSAISAKLLQDKFQQIKALKQIILLDACHAGASTQLLAKRGSATEKALAQISRSEGIHILGAAGSEQQATEFGALGHGVFTFVLLEGISGKADGSPKDGKVTIYELISYLDDQVPELSQKYQGQAQYPYTFSLGHDFPITFIAR